MAPPRVTLSSQIFRTFQEEQRPPRRPRQQRAPIDDANLHRNARGIAVRSVYFTLQLNSTASRGKAPQAALCVQHTSSCTDIEAYAHNHSGFHLNVAPANNLVVDPHAGALSVSPALPLLSLLVDLAFTVRCRFVDTWRVAVMISFV